MALKSFQQLANTVQQGDGWEIGVLLLRSFGVNLREDINQLLEYAPTPKSYKLPAHGMGLIYACPCVDQLFPLSKVPSASESERNKEEKLSGEPRVFIGGVVINPRR